MELEFEFRQKIIRLTPPKSLATCMDFVSVWSSQIPRSQFSRLCAGAIAVSAPSGSGLPRYDIALGDPVAFGHGALDTLLSSGVTPSRIYTSGAQLLGIMAQGIPTEEEIESAINFSDPTEEESSD